MMQSQLVLIFSLFSIASSSCPPQWVDGSSVGLGCMLFDSTERLSWADATQHCSNIQNAILIEIMSQEQFEFIKMILEFLSGHEGRKYWWTSGTDWGREGQWYWAQSLSEVASYIWKSGQPNGGTDQNCLYLWGGTFMGQDYPCTYPLYPICQIK